MRHLVPLALILTACSDNTAPKPPTNPMAGTYSEYAIDNQQLPVSTPADTCQRINMGGWLSLGVDGTYAMSLDKTSLMCNGVLSGLSYVAQRGSYEISNTTDVIFTPEGTYGPPFVATFEPGTYQPGQGGTLRSLRFDFVGHTYWAIEDVPVLGSHQ